MSESRQAVPVSRLLALARPEIRVLALATGALLISSSMMLAFPQVIRWMVDSVVVDGDLSRLNDAAGALVVLFLIQSVFAMVRAWLFTVAGERVVARLRTDLFRAVIGQEIAFFDKTRTGELTNRLASDTTVLQNTVTVNISMALRHVVAVIGGITLLLWMSPSLTMVTLMVVPIVAIGAATYGRMIRRLSSKVQDALAESSQVAEETISGVRTVRAFAAEAREVARYSEAVDTSYRLAAKRALAYGAFAGIIGFAGYATLALVVWFGGRMVIEGTMTIGDLTAFLLYTMMVAVAMGSLSSLYSDFMRAAGSSDRVFQLLDRASGAEEDGGTSLGHVAGAIAFDGVRFAYPSRPDIDVLTAVSLTIRPGEVVALVGPSGSGKSTVASLLLRFYDPNEGSITLDGKPLTDLDAHSLRRSVGIVSQEPILFSTSIADNIRYGRPEASDAEVRAAAAAANASGFIHDFPEGFDTEVGERGVRLSGGQKQRVAIARALLKDPAVLILDEATSALDAENEHLVHEALERLMAGRTTLVIAHRLSTIQSADRVVVLQAGRVEQQGSHDALMNAGGLYRELVERQLTPSSPVHAARIDR